MKIARIALVLILSMLIILCFTGCRCVPSSVEWHFLSYKGQMTFVGGITKEVGFSDASHAYPFAGIENSNIGISFSNDGAVKFTTKEDVTHNGTYTYEHRGLNYTKFTITLDNGEVITGEAMKGLNGTLLSFVYQGTTYNFSADNRRSGTTMDQIIQQIRSGDVGSLHPVDVIKEGDGYAVRFSELVYYYLSSETAVYAVHIHTNGSYEILDSIHEGKALSTYNESANYVVIYYVD